MNDKKTIKNRAVFFIGGYDPKSPEAFYDRLDKEAGRYEILRNVEVDGGEIKTRNTVTKRTFETRHDGSTVQTDFQFVSLDDIVLKDFDQTFLIRLRRYLNTFSDYMISGTGFAFINHAWRFSLYFFYPFIMLLVGTLASAAVASMIWNSGVSLAWLTAPVIFLATFSAFIQMIAKKYFVLHLMDLWSFSRDFIYRSRADIDEKLQSVSAVVAHAANSGDYDEIVLVGHSTGGALILDVAYRAIHQLNKRATSITVLTVGSTALKIGLHPKADWFRQQIQALNDDSRLHWVEYQCRTDLINFFNTHPSELMRVSNASKPNIHAIRIKHMIGDKTYKRIKRNFFRVHYQFVFGNTKHYHYDFPDICFGSIALTNRETPKVAASKLN